MSSKSVLDSVGDTMATSSVCGKSQKIDTSSVDVGSVDRSIL